MKTADPQVGSRPGRSRRRRWLAGLAYKRYAMLPRPSSKLASAHVSACERCHVMRTSGAKASRQTLSDMNIRFRKRNSSSGSHSPCARRPNTATTPLKPAKVAPTPAKPRRMCKTCSSTNGFCALCTRLACPFRSSPVFVSAPIFGSQRRTLLAWRSFCRRARVGLPSVSCVPCQRPRCGSGARLLQPRLSAPRTPLNYTPAPVWTATRTENEAPCLEKSQWTQFT